MLNKIMNSKSLKLKLRKNLEEKKKKLLNKIQKMQKNQLLKKEEDNLKVLKSKDLMNQWKKLKYYFIFIIY